jgi:hypothetical protein
MVLNSSSRLPASGLTSEAINHVVQILADNAMRPLTEVELDDATRRTQEALADGSYRL